MLPPFVQDLGHGVHAIDTAFQRDLLDAAYLVVHEGQAAFIDTGTNHAVPRLLAALQALGLSTADVAWVIPTHVHLDHAGGVGRLLQNLPRAQVLVHPRGARHLIDPAALWAGALAVYGAEEMARSYGELVPVPAARVQTSSDGLSLDLAGRALVFADTPGHARHHHCIWDPSSRGWFTGDTFGLSYREFDTALGPWIMPTAVPPQFDPESLRLSIRRLLSFEPESMYLTHFSRVGEVRRLGSQLLQMLDEMVAMAEQLRNAPDRHQALKRGQLALFEPSLRAHGVMVPGERIEHLLAIDLELNAQGLGIWLDK